MPSNLKLFFALILATGFVAALWGQGLTTTATKDDWEEINFEFDSSILSDGYPSLLRLAELLQQNPDYKVRVEGHTDYIGPDRYNDKLSQARAETVKAFLEKYGARPNQVEIAGYGEQKPKVSGQTREGRFMNRRVVLTVTDGQGRPVSAGGVGEAIRSLEEVAKKQEECCDEILKRLDKLDEILAMLKNLQNENAQLKQDVAGLKQAQAGVEKQVAELPRAPEREELAQIVEAQAKAAIEATRSKRFSLLAFNAGPDTSGNLSVTGKGRFFAPFGESHALQAEAEYLRYFNRQEGQVDLGLVNRYKNFQAGLFSSFKRVHLKEFGAGGTLGQAAVGFDYLFSRGRVGMYGTKSFLTDPVVARIARGPGRNIFDETYLHVVDQIGGSTQIGLHGDAYVEGNLGALFRKTGSNRPGGTFRFVQPINPQWAFTFEAGLNETLVGADHSGRFVVGLQFGNWVRPKEFVGLKHPVPMDVPRVRYELVTRTVRTGNDPPVADAGPDQIGVSPGTITLDGSNSYDPDGDPITFSWRQTSGPTVSISGMNEATATFTAVGGQLYSFVLTVKDDKGAESRARVTVSTLSAQIKIVRFTANPSTIDAGQTTTIVWEILNATEATITGLGSVDPVAGTSTVAPTQTTMYTLTARNAVSEISETITVTVRRPEVRILSFQAVPTNINPGEVSTLSWQTENATDVSISGIGPVAPSGVATVSPTVTTTYILTARNQFGEVNATATVTVAPGPRILRFTASPPEILPGEQSTLIWEVENATEVTITSLGAVSLKGSSTVSPEETTTYVLTARNPQNEVTATAIVTVVKPVKILDFVADPSRIRGGDPVTLKWQTENATEVIITGIGPVALSGEMVVNPTQFVTYTLLAYGRRSQASAFVIVKVGGGPGNRPPVADAGLDFVTQDGTVRLDGSKSFDPDGDLIHFSWRVIGPRLAEISSGDTPIPVVRFLHGFADYEFEVTVTDEFGLSATDTVRVRYVDP